MSTDCACSNWTMVGHPKSAYWPDDHPKWHHPDCEHYIKPGGTMTHKARILADSISPQGHRLTTLEVTFPRIVLAEFNTHRVFSRNSASSRAIPVEKMLRMVQDNPYIPTHWGKNQKGMQAEEELSAHDQDVAREEWLWARERAALQAQKLLDLGVHKQITNRLLEPFMWHTVIVTATEWNNWDHLRANPKAHPEIKLAAELMLEASVSSTPKQLGYTDWHMPLIFEEDWDAVISLNPTNPRAVQAMLVKISVGRCARVSYLTHDGKRDLQADIELAERLLEAGHMSPFEHVARPMSMDELEIFKQPVVEWRDGVAWPTGKHTHFCGNFDGWIQYRKTIPNEHDILGKP